MLSMEDIKVSGTNGNGGTFEILDGVSCTFEEGKMYAITGPNGGGKTSLAKAIMGIYRPSSGRITLDGRDISNLSITERAKIGIGYAFQNPVRFKGLRIRDLLGIAAGDAALAGKDNLERFLRVVGLCPRDYVGRDADASLSGGEMKRLEIAMMLARDPRIAIYDEPEAGVDLWTFERLLEVVTGRHKQRADSITIVITHNERFLRAADEILLMAQGKVQEQGDAAQIWPKIKDDVSCRWRMSCGGEQDEAECYR